jgi:hypothetical protein
MATVNRTAPARAQSRSHLLRSAPRPVQVALRRAPHANVTLAEMARAAAAMNVPVWAMLIPGLHKHRDLLVKGGLKGLEAVVENYLASTPAKRAEIEVIARAGAAVSRARQRLRVA